MKQYCRYCAFCFEGDCYYCSALKKPLGDEQIKRPNKCKEFALLNDVITGKEYKPREHKSEHNKPKIKIESATLFEEVAQ